MSAKHTQGPWLVTNTGSVQQDAEGLPRICICDNERKEHMANARLISAAPELLEALDRLMQLAARRMPLERYAQDVAIFELSRNAIRKAKGE